MNVLSLSAGAGATHPQHFATATMLLNCMICRWCGMWQLIFGSNWYLKFRFWSGQIGTL